MQSNTPPSDPSRLPRHLGMWNGALLLVTFTIGVGILQSPGVVVARTGGMALSYAAWIVGAVAAICGGGEPAIAWSRTGVTTSTPGTAPCVPWRRRLPPVASSLGPS